MDVPNFPFCKVINDRAYDLQDPTGHVRCTTVAEIQLLMPAKYIVSMLPDIKAFGCACKYINDSSTHHIDFTIYLIYNIHKMFIYTLKLYLSVPSMQC